MDESAKREWHRENVPDAIVDLLVVLLLPDAGNHADNSVDVRTDVSPVTGGVV